MLLAEFRRVRHTQETTPATCLPIRSAMNSSTNRFQRLHLETLESREYLTAVANAQPFPDVEDIGSFRQWYLNAVNAPEVWEAGFTGEGVVVAVIDSGVNYLHSDLDDNAWINTGEIPDNGIDDDGNGFLDDVHGWDFFDSDNDPIDELNHGSHVAGIVAAEDNGTGSIGVAPNATIMPIRVLGGEDGTGSSRDIASGIYYAVNNGADIINISIGSEEANRWIRRAVAFAEQRDVLIVTSAGNESAAVPNYPAAYGPSHNNILSVGAYNTSFTIADFSNGVGDSGVTQVDAPGVAIYSTTLENEYRLFSGTSMASPAVAGIAALALEANPALTATELLNLIVAGSTIEVANSDALGGANAAQIVADAWEPVRPDVFDVPGDIDGDGELAFNDYLVLSSNFGMVEATFADGDMDGDGRVDFTDYLLLSGWFAIQNDAIVADTPDAGPTAAATDAAFATV